MTLLTKLQAGSRLYDRATGRELVVQEVERHAQVVFLHIKNFRTGAVDRQPFALAEVEKRFELLETATSAFRTAPEVVSLVAEAYRLQHAYLCNPLFATETSLIDLLPHQLAAVYGVPATAAHPTAQPGMLAQPRLRFLLADDAGAGKTIMAGLVIREMLLRRLVRRVLVVPPAGLVGNWERELRTLFRLRFRILSGADFSADDNPFTAARYELAIISVDTLWRARARAAYEAAPPYDLVIFDEAHKLAARRNADLTIEKTKRYEMAEVIAHQHRHLLLLTATPHMGKDDPYYLLWRLLDPELFASFAACKRLSAARQRNYLLRRMKEEMVRFNGTRIFPPRESRTIDYPLTPGEGQEQDLYDQLTTYCETHYDRARLHNRSAAGLAMSVLQRRLASSTWAVLKSLERRAQKLQDLGAQLHAGLMDDAELATRQDSLPAQDVREMKTGDEEETAEGWEEAERQDEELAGATAARTFAELQREIAEVQRLVDLARRVYAQQRESKFAKLWEMLEQYADTKVLIFTEFRDTLEFLCARLAGKGLTGRIAQIHGGMPYPERDQQAAFFRDPHGARVLVATDAAGEGINLQFCWLLVNYDIPWNPARLEQRMGRVHRYKQEHDVLLLNLLSTNTREGRVLKVLLDKLENIRRALHDDKVFDVIGRQFSAQPLHELICAAIVQGKEAQATQEFKKLTPQSFQQVVAAQKRQVKLSQVRALLTALQHQREAAEMRRVMPAYGRRFFQLAAARLGVGIQGNIAEIFWLAPCPPSLARAVATYPEELHRRLTFDREIAMPDLAEPPRAIYLHPGEVVFEALTTLFLGEYEPRAERGAVFCDATAAAPYIFYLAKVIVLQNGANPEVVAEHLTGVRRYADDRCALAPAHLLLTLDAAAAPNAGAEEITRWAEVDDTTPVEAFMTAEVGQPALAAHRTALAAQLPQDLDQLRSAYNLRQAELFTQKRRLKDAVEREVPAAATKLRRCEAELAEIDRQRRQAELALRTAGERVYLSPVSIYARALVLPLPPEQAAARGETHAEQVALREVIHREEAAGSVIEDVSDPHLEMGFDLKVLRANGTMRYVEVKGRRGRAAVELTENEWAQAANHRARYWLYVVYDCDTIPQLYRVADPFGRLVARQLGSVRLNVREIIGASEE